jgi:hypothetical protein
MKVIQIPTPITLRDPKTGQLATNQEGVVSFRDYLYAQVLDDTRWYEPKTRLTSLIRVQTAIDSLKSTEMVLDDADWKILKEIVETPNKLKMSPNPLIQMQLLPFDDAINSAQDYIVAEAVKGNGKTVRPTA